MKKIFTNLFLLATFFLASTNLTAQTYLINDSGSYDVMSSMSSSKTKIFTISNPRPCDKLTFSNSQSWAATGGVTVTATYADGSSSEIASGKQDGSHTVSLNRKIVKELSFKGTGTLKKTISNVKVTMATYADAPGATEWTAPTATIGSPDEFASTTMEWCNTSAFTLSMTGDVAQFTYSISNNASAGNYGTATISATYKHNVAGTHNAELTITTAFGTHTIKLSGTTTKKTQSITWADALLGTDITLPVGKKVQSPATAKTEITYDVEDPTIISIDGNTLTALKAGTTTITATAAEDAEWLKAESTIAVKVTEKKVQYILWSDNLTRFKVGDEPFTLTATANILVDAENEITEAAPERNQYISYQSANPAIVSVDGNTLSINGEGETTLTATLQGDEEYEEATASMPVRVRVPSTTVCESYVLNAPEEAKYSAAGGGDYEPTALSGPAYQLTFEAKKQYVLGVGGVGDVEIQQYVNGAWNTIATINPGKDYQLYGPYTLNRNATNIRFYTGAGSYNRYFKNVFVSQATYLETTTPEITVAQSIIGDVIERTIAVQYSNIPEGVMIDHSSNKIQLSTTELGNACGTYGEKQITLTIIPTEIGTIEDVITIHDEATGKKLEIPVTVHTQRNTQTIIWEQDLANIHTTDNITLTATAQTAIHYTSSDSTIAYAEGNTLVINKHGQVTITAVAAQSEKYEQATLSKDITITTVQPTVSVWPTVEPIAYKQPLTTDMLIGGEADVEGYFEWNTELNQTLVPGTYDLAVRFMPTNTNYYAPVDGTIAVTINKSQQSIIWNNNFENITVTDSIVLTAYAQTEVTYEVSDMELAYVTENNVLYFTRAGDIQVTAYALENEYYLADTLVRDLSILPGYPTILTYPTASPISYGQTLGESALSGGQANVAGAFAWVDESALLEAGEYGLYVRFTPDDQHSYQSIDIPVLVVVNPITQTITWDLNTIEVRQGQSLQLAAVASSNLPITYSVDNTTLAKVENNTFYALEVGEVVVTASQDGLYFDEDNVRHANYTAAEPVSKTIVIVPQQSPQTIVWNDDLSNITTTDDITLSATAQAPIHYLSSDSTIAYVEADKLIIKRHGSLTLTAVAQQTEDFDQTILEKTVNIVPATPNISAWPTVQPVTYGTKLNVTMLLGGEADVDGYFDWNTDLSQELIPGTYKLGVRFVPENSDIYAQVLDSVEVVVNKAPQTIVWNNNFDKVLVSDTIILNALAQTKITYDVSDIEVAVLDGTHLYFNRSGTISVTAYAEESDLYLADTLVRELIINPTQPIILTYPTAADITHGQTLSESKLEGGLANVDGSFVWVNPNEILPVGTYMPIASFIPDDDVSYGVVENIYVQVIVHKATQTITWELSDFVVEVGDTLHLTAVATSGLEVTYTLDDDSYAEINNNVLTALQVGMVTVTASQNGTYVDEFGDEYTNYFAAEPVSQTITIVAKNVNTGANLTFLEVKATKIIRDGRLYIIRNGHIYNANGQVID